MSNLVEIIVTAKNLTGPAMASVNAEVNKAGKGMAIFHKTAGLAAAGIAAIGVESVKMASKFDSEMTLLQTQAGVSQDKIAGLKKGVLALAGQVGQTPDSLAEALYHVESNFESMGISSKKALDLTATAAKGATIGHADLVDVTNALTAAVAAGIPGVQNLDQAMGTLNATVGVGDMKMQDLASAFGSGMVATVKGFGLSIRDVGAALAVFGDNNIRGATAGTQLRMSVMALAKPIAGGEAALKSIGLAQDTLAKDMQHGGLKLALEDLVAHMQAAGIGAKQQGQLITEAFGRKAGSGLNILVGQMDRLESKYPALDAGAKNFGKSWADTQKTFAFQMKALQASFDAFMISVGEKLIPPVQAFVHVLAAHKTATVDAAVALAGLLAATVAVSAAMKAAAGFKLVAAGFAAVRREAILAQAAFVTAGGGIKGLSAAFTALSTGAKLGVAVAAIAGVALAFEKLSSSGKKAPDVDRMSTALGNLAQSGKASGELTSAFGKNLDGLAKDIDKLNGKKDGLDHFNDVMNKIFTLGFGHSNGPKQATKDIDSLDKGLAELVTSGHADQAKAALDKLSSEGLHLPSKKLDDYKAALAGTKLESDLTAQSQGRFGKQAQDVQAALKAQQDVVDGLTQSLQALDKVNQDAYGSQTKFEDAIAAMTAGLKENGRTLSLHSEAGRKNRDLLLAEAQATDDFTANLDKQGASWDTIDAAYKRGYDKLVQFAQGAGYSREAAEKLANSLIHMPKEISVKGNISDIESKLAKAKKDLASAPKSKQVQIRANISQLENEIRDAQAKVNSLTGKSIVIRATYSVVGGKGTNVFHEGGNYASGGRVVGPGSGTSDDVPIWASNGEFVVNAAATAKHRRLLEAINNGEHGMASFASGGKVSKSEQRRQAEQQERNQDIGAFSLSYFGRVAGFKTPTFERSTAGAGSIDDLVGTLNDWRSKIAAATHGAQETKLIKAFDKFGAAALRNEKNLLAVNDQLSSAKDKLASLKDSFNQLKDSVSSSIVAYGSIAKQPAANALGVVEQLQGNVNDAKRFAADLARLRKAGLNSQSLSELAQAGVEGGLSTANALAGASPAYIKQINALEKQLQAAGGSAGSTAANSTYGAGIKQAEGLVAGLEKKQKRIEQVMIRAADAMAAELKRVMGSKAKGAGGVVGAAASGGARWGATLVGEYGPELVNLPVGSRVHSAPDTARMLGGGGGGAMAPLEITLMIGDTTLGEVLVDPIRKAVRTRGGNVQAALGVRGK